MKRWIGLSLTVLVLLGCLGGLSACGAREDTVDYTPEQQEIIDYLENWSYTAADGTVFHMDVPRMSQEQLQSFFDAGLTGVDALIDEQIMADIAKWEAENPPDPEESPES